MTSNRYLVVDLEGTCCNDQSIAEDETETIEIGAIMLDAASLTTIERMQTMVKPVRHPVLTEFCRNLTGIQQCDVDVAPEFPLAFARFCRWARIDDGMVFASWGSYDRDQFTRDCSHHHLHYPFTQHFDVARLFRAATGRRRGRRAAMRFLGLSAKGPNHRGLSDAGDVAEILTYLLAQR